MTTPVPVAVVDTVSLDETVYETVFHGYTLDIPTTQPFEVLPEDPTRVRAIVSANSVFWLGDKQQMQAAASPVTTTGTAGPGARFGNGVDFLEVTAQNQIWAVAFSAPISMGVVVERRVPKGHK